MGLGGCTWPRGALDICLVLCLSLRQSGLVLQLEEGKSWHPKPLAAVIHDGEQAAACTLNAHWVSRQDHRKPLRCFEKL